MTAREASAAYADRPIAELLDLHGRVALVTGAAQGFGFASASRLAEAGASVLLTDRRGDRVEAAAARLSVHGERVSWAVGELRGPGCPPADPVAGSPAYFCCHRSLPVPASRQRMISSPSWRVKT